MKAKISMFLRTVTVFILAVMTQQLSAGKETHFFSDLPPRASVFGKYANLKENLICPQALYQMTFANLMVNFHDLGYNKKPKPWCDSTLPKGYVVYYGGVWYIWEKQVRKAHPKNLLESMNNTYNGLIKKKYCRNMKTKGDFIEFGHRSSPMCDNPNKPDTGYFVYVRPYVYIYQHKNLPLQYVPKEVYAKGRYKDLENAVRCDIQGERVYDGSKMKDSKVVLEFDDEYQRANLWPDYCTESLGPGHYVYQYPYWYAFKNKRPEAEEPEENAPPRE